MPATRKQTRPKLGYKRIGYKRMNKIRLFGTIAVRNLKGNVMLSILMLAAIGVLISASITTLMLLTAMVREPLPLPQQPVQLASLQNENGASSGIEWSVGTNRICDGKSAGSIRLLL